MATPSYSNIPFLIIVIIVWFVFCHLVANSAQKSGRSYSLFLILSIITSPIVGGIVLVVANAIEEKSLNSEAKQKKAELDSYIDKADALKKYKELLDNGVITQEEFEVKKQQILES